MSHSDSPAPAVSRSIGRTVLVLGIASFLTDVSSEMIFPLLPAFLAVTLGAGPAILGIIEGIAEATSSILKVASGWWTDSSARRKAPILFGYSVSGLAKPLMGLASSWWLVLFLRFSDRVGKGIRTSPRDALIADVTHEHHRGAAYGFHRAMDHAGAVVGPLVAMALLRFAGMDTRDVFLLAGIPAFLVVVVLAIGVSESPRDPLSPPRSAMNLREGWNLLGRDFRVLLGALLLFMLGNASDAFLLMRLHQVGISTEWVALLWSLHHVVKSASTYIAGRMTDRWGPRRMIVAGWILYAVVYILFGFLESVPALVATFLVYGIHFGLTEPSEKAWVASLVPSNLRGTAFGFYHGVIGVGALPASVLFGLLWEAFGPEAAFLTGAAFAALGSAVLFRIPADTTRPGARS